MPALFVWSKPASERYYSSHVAMSVAFAESIVLNESGLVGSTPDPTVVNLAFMSKKLM